MKKLGIVKSFIAFFNLEEEGKVLSFFNKVEKSILKEMKVVEFNFEQEKFKLENKISTLKDRLEDIQEEFEQSFLDINMNNIETKQGQEDYVDTYLSNIRNKEVILEKVKEELADTKTALKDIISNRKNTMDKLNNRLKTLNDGVDTSNIIKKQ